MTTTSAPPAGITLQTVATGMWRAVDRSGRVLGNLRSEPSPEGERFRALRFHPPSRSFTTVGEFWSRDDAVDCLRFGG